MSVVEHAYSVFLPLQLLLNFLGFLSYVSHLCPLKGQRMWALLSYQGGIFLEENNNSLFAAVKKSSNPQIQ